MKNVFHFCKVLPGPPRCKEREREKEGSVNLKIHKQNKESIMTEPPSRPPFCSRELARAGSRQPSGQITKTNSRDVSLW